MEKKRIDEFFSKVAEDLQSLSSQYKNLEADVAKLPDLPEVTELCVAAAKRESNDTKRLLWPKLYLNFLKGTAQTTQQERADLIHHLEYLGAYDLRVLARFRDGSSRGDILTGTHHYMAQEVPRGSVTGKKSDETAWLLVHGDTVHSVAKLVARGLIYPMNLNWGFAYSG
ncbi:MAG: hypothetical protein EOP85_16905, partial [Verrucomicrobiaceae bacterium]